MFSQIKHLILDMDGVLWRGETAMPGLVEFFSTLDTLGTGYVMATNNATKTAVQYTEKFKRFGLDIPPEKILTSAETTAAYLRESYENGTPVYVIGDRGLREALQARDFEVVPAADVRAGARPALVVVGFTPHAVYEDLAMGALLINHGARFVGTNPDPSIPSELGPLPGAGALLALLTAATSVEPEIVGKPQKLIFEHALRRLGSEKKETAMVGDRLTTDVAGAKAAGLWAILLLSGIAAAEDIQHLPYQPDFVFEDIRELGAELARAAQDTHP